jgi:DNA-binding transcriptional MerR regulator
MQVENEVSPKQRSKPKTLRFTVPRDEAREAVGISPKQLRTWQEQGLFSPELGKGSQRFTESDVERLKFLARLVLELGLPTPTIKDLYARFYHGPVSREEQRQYEKKGLTQLPSAPAKVFTFLDLQAKRLCSYGQAFLAIRDAMARSPGNAFQQNFVESRLMTLMAIRASMIRTGNPGVYKAELDALIDRLRSAALAARVERVTPWDDDTTLKLATQLPDDPELTQEELRDLRQAHVERMGYDPDEPPF